jgi:hypothetical protein
MKVSRRWIEWAHEPPAESGVEASARLCELAEAPGTGNIEVTDPALLKELVSVAECYRSPTSGDALYDMGPQPGRIITEGRAALRALQQAA